MVQLKVILDTRKIRADGTFSIYFRITEFKKVFYFHSGFTIQQQYWNDQEKKVSKSHKQAQTINSSISKKHFEIQKAIIELEDEGIFSMDSLKEKLKPKVQNTAPNSTEVIKLDFRYEYSDEAASLEEMVFESAN